MHAFGLQHLPLNAFVGVDQLHEPFGRFAQRFHRRAAIAANGTEDLRDERVAVVVQLLHLGRKLGVLLGVVQLHFLRNQVVPSLEQLIGQMQFLFVLRCNQAVELLMQFAMHRAGVRCDGSCHPHVAGRFFLLVLHFFSCFKFAPIAAPDVCFCKRCPSNIVSSGPITKTGVKVRFSAYKTKI